MKLLPGARPGEVTMMTVERYLEVFEGLRRRKRWSTNRDVLRFAALTLAALDERDPGARLEETAKVLARQARVFSPLKSSIRHAVAAMLIRRKLDPVRVVSSVEDALVAFKASRLRRGGARPLLAALLLVLHARGGAVPRHRIAGMKAILDRWNEDHRFLTGVDDYAMAALHATRGVAPGVLGAEVEAAYQALRQAGFRRGNQLQLVSHILALAELGPAESAVRFSRLAAALQKAGQRIGTAQYDEVALLVLGDGRPAQRARQVIDYRERLRVARPRPQKSLAFSLATGLVLARQAEHLEGIGGAAAAANLQAVQTLIEVQQAAMIAAITAATAASAAASSS